MNRLGKFIRFVAVFVAACLIVSVSPDIVKVKAGDYYTLNGKEIGKYSDVDRVQADGGNGTISFNPDLGMIVQVYGNNITKINIPATINGVKVRSIADWAIQYRENVMELTLPEGIEVIGDGNFRGLKVKKIVIPGSVSSIGNSTFSYSDYLEEVVFEDGKLGKTLGDWSLQNCPALKSVYFGEGFVTLGQGTGRFDNKLETVHFPTTIKSLGNYSFRYCINLENVSVGKKSINYMHEFKELGISLGDYPFTQCYFLRKDFSPSYKTSKWYTAVHELKLTGDYAKDILFQSHAHRSVTTRVIHLTSSTETTQRAARILRNTIISTAIPEHCGAASSLTGATRWPVFPMSSTALLRQRTSMIISINGQIQSMRAAATG